MAYWENQADDDRLLKRQPPSIQTVLSPAEAFDLACDMALLGLGFVSPNPPVGAVAVDSQHRFLAAGAHRFFGGPHAEVELVQNLKKTGNLDKLAGGTIYVTLEPCCYHGKTPACTDLLKTLPCKQVFYGVADPNPKVSGQGANLLGEAGIKCELFSEADRAKELIEVFTWNQATKKPFVALKVASTLDGSIAYENSSNFSVTGSRAKMYGHFLRLKYDGIMIGAKTLVTDNPQLNCRFANEHIRDPRRIVLDPSLEGLRAFAGKDLNLIKSNPELNIFVVAKKLERDETVEKLQKLGSKFIFLATNAQGYFELEPLLKALYEFQIYSLLLEGGAALYSSFTEANLVNKLHLFQAPRILGGEARLHWTNALSAKNAWTCKNVRIIPLAEDWVIEAKL